MMRIILEASLDTALAFLVYVALMSLVWGIANVVRRKPLLDIGWRRVSLWSLVICAVILVNSYERYRDLYFNVRASKGISEASAKLIIEVKQAVHLPGPLDPELHGRFWSVLLSAGYTEKEILSLVDNTLCSTHARALQLLFWSDVLVTLQTGQPFTSPERASIEAEHFSESDFIERNRQSIEKIAVGEPIESQGMQVVITEDYARLIYLELKEGNLTADKKCSVLKDNQAFD